ncbi:MAG: acyl-CoA dehydratase activase-related protein, partial [Coriobacteriia bacterium]|nr:acyl-CoA dehydratase activase-related protein [Coriobacteriia bacterium]
MSINNPLTPPVIASEARSAQRGNLGQTSAESQRMAEVATPTPAKVRSTLLAPHELAALAPQHRTTRCKLCSNACLLTINSFGKDPHTGRTRRFITGNRCERGAGVKTQNANLPNLFAYKNSRLFDGTPQNPYVPLEPAQAPRPTVGLPRVLNMYENYPFWFTFFRELGFATVLSEETRKSTYEAGIESMPSESVCYPAKLAHGHIMDLLNRGHKDDDKDDTEDIKGTVPFSPLQGQNRTVPFMSAESPIDFIFMPCIRYERQEDEGSPNHFNCPVVVSY